MKPLHQKIKELRLEKGWSIREMAQKIYMSHTAYANIENNNTPPAWDRILKIAKIHGISPLELLGSDAVTQQQIEDQIKFDDLYEILLGINKELQAIKIELSTYRSNLMLV
jgi:transcriptional regulator with XRE-family HTH domain